jgi:hypothetical protein
MLQPNLQPYPLSFVRVFKNLINVVNNLKFKMTDYEEHLL